MPNNYYSNGKLLLTGEYAVLDGALSLAVPTIFGQSLSIKNIEPHKLVWKSRDVKGNIWFEHNFDRDLFSINTKVDNFKSTDPIAQTLYKILAGAKKLNPLFLSGPKGFETETRLGFPQDWGLGTSSTLINNIAQWAQVDAFELQWNTLGGSGYDIACAQHDTPVLYRLTDGRPNTKEIGFDPPFKTNLFFVHLNKKQDSREGILNYRKRKFYKPELIDGVSAITREILSCNQLSQFEALIEAHEELLAKTLDLSPVREQYFSDYPGAVKSLGAWGGDFVLATGNDRSPDYFYSNGFKTVIPYRDMVKF
ncbi:GHMP kinase [Flavobacteriaceae bacterium F89]|uniref:GHMP kinase n=1 Tax=Cerina litoralis TaxID=2874477 RepID=A0AAE3JQD8_9FLAO|nr:GYDIA family GHMP kinase [Cerina litoralis]MCG2461759.1 GHMP kinase [Cerina litoralis]